ncbi:MAG TPA: hypothetical protein VHG32_06415 [Thermoanaerobaculia bacterium]|jgi:hypothetical protein|nr:hypothetical protein [Thermoanaerobaculia bacterium]
MFPHDAIPPAAGPAQSVTQNVGAFLFGVVVGWITHRTLQHQRGAAISDIAAVVGTVGGGAVIAIFRTRYLFAYYSMGLAIGFFLYLIIVTTSGKLL